MSGFLASWMPKLGGFILFLGVLFGQLGRNFDDDPETKCDWNAVYAAGATFGALLTVRQNGVTSEKVGCTRSHKD
jgi:hypothetical protein